MPLTKEERIELLAKARAVKSQNAKMKKEGKVVKEAIEPEPVVEVKVDVPIPETPEPKPKKIYKKKDKPVEEVNTLDIAELPSKPVEKKYSEVVIEEEVVKAPTKLPKKKIIKKIIEEIHSDSEDSVEYQYEKRKVIKPDKDYSKPVPTPVKKNLVKIEKKQSTINLFDY